MPLVTLGAGRADRLIVVKWLMALMTMMVVSLGQMGSVENALTMS
jgi:hypothetical protein